jgi:pimeloyl-ACP methyl ester carboxylesterase
MTWRLRRAWWAVGATALAAAGRAYATRRYFTTTPPPTTFVHEDVRTAWTPAWRELLTGIQWLRLRQSAVYRVEGVPRGDGSPVLLVHGFLSRHFYLDAMRAWLERLGYRARIANLGWNADCYDVLARRVRADADDAARAVQGRVHLVGHSLGGVLARAVAAQAPEMVGSITTLATPFRGLRFHPGLRLSHRLVRSRVLRDRGASVFPECMTFACQCATVRALAAPLPATVPQLAVVPHDDGLIDFRYEADRATTRVLDVPGSHMGVVFEPVVYEALAHHLASASGVRAPRTSAGS